jgi:hypothetical protein
LTGAAGLAPGTAAIWVLGIIAVTTFGTAVYRSLAIARQLR